MPLGLLRGLLGGNRNNASKEEGPRKDKYAQRKQNEADLKAAHKKELQEAKHAAKEVRGKHNGTAVQSAGSAAACPSVSG